MVNQRQIAEYKKDQIIVFTTGEYSSFGIWAVGRVLKDFSDLDLEKLPNVEIKVYNIYHHFSIEYEWLVKAGLVEMLEYNELHDGITWST